MSDAKVQAEGFRWMALPIACVAGWFIAVPALAYSMFARDGSLLVWMAAIGTACVIASFFSKQARIIAFTSVAGAPYVFVLAFALLAR